VTGFDERLRARGIEARLERLRELMERRSLGALLLRRPANFAWCTGGADSRVDHVSPFGVADVVVTPDAEYVLTNAIEAPRMRDEQTPAWEVVEYPWHEDSAPALDRLAAGARLGADVPIPEADDLELDVARLRRVLDPDAIERLRAVGAAASEAIAAAADALEPGIEENVAASMLAAECRRRGLSSPVLLAAADGRIARYRHPIPAAGRIECRAMLVVSAERYGLYGNVTRIVDLEEPGPELERRSAACDEILRRTREEATRPGRTVGEVFADIVRFYAEAGFPEEWKLHHQGGLTGYGSRELIATPGAADPIENGQAFAWNPSITGAKAEETFVLTAAGPELVASGAGPGAMDRIAPES
jgi:Xaa-Pro aminopeptidase